MTAGWLSSVEGRRPCSLQTTIRFTIVGARGAAAHGRWSVSTVLRPWSAIVHTWVWRNWCEADQGSGPVTITISSSGGQRIRQRVSDPPLCVRARGATTVVDRGTAMKYVQRPGDRIPPHILPKGTPPPLPGALIEVKNAWLVSDGYTLVAVYAGAAGNDPRIGRFAIVRQNAIFGIQYAPPDLVDVGKVGALTITGWPTGASRERSAQRGELRFSSARGAKGVLDLVGDHVRVTSRN